MEHAVSGELGNFYLDITRILPGDILLTTSHGLSASVIRTLTQSSYSHCALVLTAVALLEADDRGIAHKFLACHRAEIENAQHGPRLLHGLSAPVMAATVLRKPSFAAFLARKGADLVTLTRPVLAQSYAPFAALAETLHEIPHLKAPARLVGEAIDWIRHRGPEPGLFCSQIIAAVYEGILGEALIPGLEPHQFSPNTFLSLGWDVVPDAITRLDESTTEAPELVEPMNKALRVAFGES